MFLFVQLYERRVRYILFLYKRNTMKEGGQNTWNLLSIKKRSAFKQLMMGSIIRLESWLYLRGSRKQPMSQCMQMKDLENGKEFQGQMRQPWRKS